MHLSGCSPVAAWVSGMGQGRADAVTGDNCLCGRKYAQLFNGHRSNCRAVSTVILERHSVLLCTAPSSGLFLNSVIASCQGTVSE